MIESMIDESFVLGLTAKPLRAKGPKEASLGQSEERASPQVSHQSRASPKGA